MIGEDPIGEQAITGRHMTKLILTNTARIDKFLVADLSVKLNVRMTEEHT